MKAMVLINSKIKICLLVISTLCSIHSFSQSPPPADGCGSITYNLPNLVKNPCFCDKTGSYSGSGFGSILSCWWSGNEYGSPDHSHCEYTHWSAQVGPGHIFGGPPVPYCGEGYVGMHLPYGAGGPLGTVTYIPGEPCIPGGAARESIETELLSPLIAGVTYTLSFYVARGSKSNLSVDSIGAMFSTAPLWGCPDGIQGPPDIVNSGGFFSSTNWTLFSEDYIATGGERFLTIGVFGGCNQRVEQVGSWPLFYVTYSFIDGVSLTPQGVTAPLDQCNYICNPLLPIELSSFTAECANNQVELNWSTLSESNNDYFTIEKSRDGINWSVLTTVDGAEQSTAELTYQTIDANPFHEATYYRLKQTDFNGDFEYFKTVVVTSNDCNGESFISGIFPNPTNAKFSFTSNFGSSNTLYLEMFNSLGQLVLAKEFNSSGTIEVDASGLESGVYTAKFKLGTKIEIHKIVISK